MDRKDFIKKSVLGSLAIGAVGALAKANSSKKHDVGFNHLPNSNSKIMENIVIHKAETRGHANHGWLDSYHTFSFANYHNPERMNFGALRVLNDDTVEQGMGFGTHPHRNMEIISIPLEGDLEHKDSMGNVAIIKEGDVQVMSAGKGVTHSEYNKNKDSQVKFLQIWVIPNKMSVTPRYDQISIREIAKDNEFYQVLSPNADDQGVWIHQEAWFYLGSFEKEKSDEYKIKKQGNGVYLFVLNGEVEVENQKLSKRDGMGIWDIDSLTLKATERTRVLLMEVPMNY